MFIKNLYFFKGDQLKASVRALAPNGRFLEIGKFDLNNDTPLGMSVFLKNVAFHGILLDSLFGGSSGEWLKVHDLVSAGISSGVVRPLKATTFGSDEIEAAFRFMAQGKHIGKVLIRTRSESSQRVLGLAKLWLDPGRAFIITGGLGGFGLELAQWLIERGARKLILTSRGGVRNGFQYKKIQMLRNEFNAQIEISQRDVSDPKDCSQLIQQSIEMSRDGKIGGVYHLAAVLEDASFENQTLEKFQAVSKIKIDGAINLDKLTREVSDDQTQFVVFSSVTSGRGNFGQSNYGLANSAMERVCEKRRREGFGAVAVQWGAIGDVGMVAESAYFENNADVAGTLPQKINVCLKTMEYLLIHGEKSAVWSSFVPSEKASKEGKKNTAGKSSIVETVANILGIKDVKEWKNESATLSEMGLDSLMSVEVRQVLEQTFNLSLTPKEIQQLTLAKLKTIQSVEISSLPISEINEKETGKTLMPNEKLVKLNEGVKGEEPVFIVHPIEGHVGMLKLWPKHVNKTVFGIQYTKDAIGMQSVSDLAAFYWTVIEEKMKELNVEKVHLCGYSFGASVAFEMACLLGEKVLSLSLLDGSHSYVAAHVDSYKNKFSLEDKSQTESEALYTFVQQNTTIVNGKKEFIETMIVLPDLESRIKEAAKFFIKVSTLKFNVEDVEEAMKSYLTRLLMSHKYQPLKQLSLSQILLVKSGQQNNLAESLLGVDYGLSKVFNGEIKLDSVPGDHQSFLEFDDGKQLASILNKHFSNL